MCQLLNFKLRECASHKHDLQKKIIPFVITTHRKSFIHFVITIIYVLSNLLKDALDIRSYVNDCALMHMQSR